jgi:prephenate dehydrogenase
VKIAVLGVGLIGGSVGLAARERLGAEVAGWDPSAEHLELALERGAIDAAATSVAEACEGAEVVFCAAPVAALAELAREALAATGEGTAVTDVGSTKLDLAETFAGEPRFVGGHPVAGAETAGVEHARADLFDGARWYLTPTDATEGISLDRLQKAIAGLGARPQAIDAAAHDRIMATISHLPHAIANVLAAQAAASLGDGVERLPEVGPSFRDTTRVAGANPAIWGDIFATNGEAVAEEIDAVVVRLQDTARLLREGRGDELEEWHRRAGEDRRELLAAGAAEGGPRELSIRVPNRPGILAEIALALGNANVNIEDMTLSPVEDMSSGSISVWVRGAEESERAAALVRALGHDVTLLGS